jgi:PAS domain S-box-containing protein
LDAIKAASEKLHFLHGGGEMRALIRSKNWALTQLGEPEGWPQSLRTMVSMILDNPFGMCIVWGADFIQLYNDGFRPMLGSTKHPRALGISARETLSEIWHIIEPMFSDVFKGNPARVTDFMVQLNRNGFVEDCYFDFSYSPIKSEDGRTCGILVTVIETTDKKKSIDSLKENEERFRSLIDKMPNLAYIADAKGSRYWYNKTWFDYTGTSLEEMKGLGWHRVHHPDTLPEVVKNWEKAIETGEGFEMTFPLKGADGSYRQFLTRILPEKDKNGKVYRWFGTGTDITQNIEFEKALTDSKEQFQFAIDAAELGTFDYNPFTNKFFGNDRLKAWFGLPQEAEIELPQAIKAIDEKDRQRVVEAIAAVLEYGSGKNYDIEYTIIHPVTKKQTQVRAKGKASFKNKIAFRFTGTLEDITDQAAGAKQLKETVERYHNLIHSSPFAIGILFGEDLIISVANRAIIEIWGKGWEIMGKAYFTALPELAEQGYKEVFAQVFKTGIPFNAVETPVDILQDGKMQLKYYNFLLFPQKDINGRIDGVGIIATEVTSQALLNKQIKEREKRFRILADSMPHLIWTTDQSGNLNYYNEAFYDYCRMSMEQLNKEGWTQLIHPDDREENIKKWTHSVTTGQDFSDEYRFLKHDQEYRWQLSRATALRDDEGNITMWVGSSTDIHDLKELEKQKDFFISMASHELKTPITSIKGYAQILQRKYEKSEDAFLQNSLRIISKQTLNLNNLVADLLDISKIRSGSLNLNKENFEITDLINEVIKEIENINPDYHISASLKTALVQADRERIGQVLINFLTNAIKYAPGSKEIRLVSKIENRYIIVSVEDFGIGINEKDQGRIFERFYRVEGKNEKTFPGFGIGLYIVSEIIKKHNGNIWVKSKLGQGSVFYFSLPIIE